MTVRQLVILDCLSNSLATETELVDYLNISRTSVFRALERFEALDFIVYKVDDNDKRKIKITLSNKAQKFLKEFEHAE